MKKLLLSLLLPAVWALAEIEPQTGGGTGSGTSNVSEGGTGVTSITDNALIYGNGTSPIDELPVLGNGGLVIGTGGAPSTGTITGVANETDVTNAAGTITIGIVDPLIVGKGGTGAASLTDGGVLFGSGTGAITPSAVLTNGQLLIGDGTTDPSVATLTGNDAVVVTNGAGSITLSLDASSATLLGNRINLDSTNEVTGTLPVANGGTNATSAGDARTSLGLAIGTNVQAYDADLDDLADGSLTGSKVGSGVPAANIASGNLGSSVVASSVAAIIVPATCGSATISCRVTFGADGRIQSASSSTIAEVRPSFSAHKNGTDQTGVVSGQFTKLTFSTEEFDTDGYFDTANSSFTPLTQGKYLLTATAEQTVTVDGTQSLITIYKNGSEYARGNVAVSGGTASVSVAVTAIVDANGSTDFFEAYFLHTAGSDRTIDGTTVKTKFSGSKL